MTGGWVVTNVAGKMANSPHGRPPSAVAVVDACSYGRLGLQQALVQAAQPSCQPDITVFDRVAGALTAACRNLASSPDAPSGEHCLVLRLSARPSYALQQLLYLSGEGMAQAGFRRLIVLSPFMMNNFIRHVLVCCEMALPVRIVSSRHPPAWLCRVVLAQGTLLQVGDDELLPRAPALRLTTAERRVLLSTLQEIPIPQQARLRHRNHKTLYAQRNSALIKLRARNLAQLLRRVVSM